MFEFFKQPGIYECCFFLLGIFCYRFLSKFLKISAMYVYIKTLGQICFEVVSKVYVQLLIANDLKEQFLKKSEMPSDEVEKLISNDRAKLEEWKREITNELENFSPEAVAKTFMSNDKS